MSSMLLSSKMIRSKLGLQSLLRKFSSSPPRSPFWPNLTSDSSVLVSSSRDIFTNLALEEWIYRHVDFSHNRLMLLWQNSPCVVIGRHQNPWTEANLGWMRSKNVKLARRNSGGGTVYHDEGNLNCTFFTSKKDHDRDANLRLICQAIKRISPNTDVQLNRRHDLVLHQRHKISGTAAKLGRLSSYHHCTLLVNADKENLREALVSRAVGVASRATASVRATSIANLGDFDKNVDIKGLKEALTNVYHKNSDEKTVMVEPNESNFQGLDEIREQLESYEWVFGKTPAFHIEALLPADDVHVVLHVRQGQVDLVEVEGVGQEQRRHLDELRGLQLNEHLSQHLQILLRDRVESKIIEALTNCLKGIL